MVRRPTRWLLFTGVCLGGTLAPMAVLAGDEPQLEPTPAAVEHSVTEKLPQVPADEPALTARATPAPSDAKSTTAANDQTTTTAPDGVQVEVIRERFPDGKVKIERQVVRDKDDNYVNHGTWKMWDTKGNVVGEGNYVHGQRNGAWTGWFMPSEVDMLTQMPYREFAGPFVSKADFENGKLNGNWTIFDAKNHKISEWGYANGQRHGLWTTWYANGRKMREVNYVNGELDGDIKEWSPEGVATTSDHYQQGRKLARKVEFHTANQKKSDGMFLFAKQELQSDDNWWDAKLAKFTTMGKDERHGEWTAWHPNGQVQVKGHYEHDLPVGEFTWWYPNGQKASVGSFVHGQRQGDWTWYHQNGQKSTHGGFEVGGPSGIWIWWNDGGKVAQKVNYAAGKGETVKTGTKAATGRGDSAATEQFEVEQPGSDLVPQSASAPEPPVKR